MIVAVHHRDQKRLLTILGEAERRSEEDDEEEKHLRVEEAYCYSYSHLKMQKLKLKNFYSACEREEFAPVTP